MFLEAIGFPHPAFDQVSVNGPLKIPFGNGNQNLVMGIGLIGMGHEKDLEREQIKRGALFKELLYIFFSFKPFFPGEREFPHRDQIKSISFRETPPERIICALSSSRRKQSVSYGLLPYAKPALGGHWQKPFFHGNRACSFSFCGTADTYVSLSYCFKSLNSDLP
jgi:hypothetical protein